MNLKNQIFKLKENRKKINYIKGFYKRRVQAEIKSYIDLLY